MEEDADKEWNEHRKIKDFAKGSAHRQTIRQAFHDSPLRNVGECEMTSHCTSHEEDREILLSLGHEEAVYLPLWLQLFNTLQTGRNALRITNFPPHNMKQ